MASCKGSTPAAGGDTIAAIEKLHVGDNLDNISTTAGAFLEYEKEKELLDLKV